MTRFLLRCILLTAVVLAIVTGSLTLSVQTATAWTMGDPIVSYWVADTLTEAMAQQAVAGGFNIAWINQDAGQTEMIDQLDIAQAHGLRGMVHAYVLKPAFVGRAELDALIDAFKVHPAAYSYLIADEPSAAEFAGLAQLKNYIEARDPDHMVYINLSDISFSLEALGAPSYQEYLSQYVSILQPDKLISYDF